MTGRRQPPRWMLVGVVVIVATVAAPSLAQDEFGQLDERRAAMLAALDFGGLSNSLATAMLQDPFPQAHADAARALASEADPARAALIGQYAGDSDPWARMYAMVAAGRIGPPGLDVARRGLGDPVALVRQAAAWACCHGGPDAFGAIARLVDSERDPVVLETAVANLWRLGEQPWEALASRYADSVNPGLRRAAAVSLARSRRPERSEALRRLAADDEPVIRATALAGLADDPVGDGDRQLVVAALSDQDWRVRAGACQVLAARTEIGVADAAASRVVEMWTSEPAQLAVSAVRAAGAHPGVGEDEGLAALAVEAEPWTAAEALSALARRRSPRAAGLAASWVDADEVWRRRAAAAAAPWLPAEAAVKVERRVLEDRDAAVRLAWLEALDADTAASRGEALWQLVRTDPDAAVRARALELLADTGALADPARALELASSWSGDTMPDARAAALVAALELSDGSTRASIVERGVSDPDRAVAALVVNEARRLGLPAALPHGESRHGRQWYRDLLRWVEEQRWLDVVTVRGTIRIRLELAETPITAREIWDLAERGFYDGLTIHRVVPNFVVQGGDPRGDGWGGPGFVVPDEPTVRPFDSWRVGIATSGPQTGGCQLFVTLLPADRLTGHYTNLGEVVAGRDVLDRIQVGDRIVRVETAAGPEPPPPPPVLLGHLEWSELAELDGWQAEWDGYVTDPASVAALEAVEGSYRIVTVLGTWCEDSQREVPRLARVLEEVAGDRFELELVGVDRTKRVTDREIAALLPSGSAADRVPTILVLDELGQELGRIVETAEQPLEQLLEEFVAPAEGWR